MRGERNRSSRPIHWLSFRRLLRAATNHCSTGSPARISKSNMRFGPDSRVINRHRGQFRFWTGSIRLVKSTVIRLLVFPFGPFDNAARMAVAMIMSAKQTVKAGLARSRIFRVASRFLEPAVVILRYHSVQEDPSLVGETIGSGITHSTVSFESEMRILARDFKVISLEDLLASLRAGRSLARRS